jgi:hypothetical protein
VCLSSGSCEKLEPRRHGKGLGCVRLLYKGAAHLRTCDSGRIITRVRVSSRRAGGRYPLSAANGRSVDDFSVQYVPQISDLEFAQFQRFIYDAAGITLSDSKKALVSGRLAKRLAACRIGSYGEYLRFLKTGESPAEKQMVVDLLTTNETYFFREPKHFQFLRKEITSAGRAGVRVWSAAGSTGEEAYSIAMVLEDCLPGQPWEAVASDIRSRVLARARASHYRGWSASRTSRPDICSASV